MTRDVRDLLDETMTDTEPPLSITAKDIVAAGRRRQFNRRLSWMGGTVAAVAALAVTVGFALPGSTEGGETALPADETETATEDRYPVVDDWEEYSQAVWDLFVEQGPDYRYVGEEVDTPFLMSEWGDGDTGDADLPDKSSHMGNAFLKTLDGTPVGSVSVKAYQPGTWTDQPSDDPYWHVMGPWDPALYSCWSGETEVVQGDGPGAPVKIEVTETSCEETTTSDGDRMVLVSRVVGYEGEEPSRYENEVIIFRADDTAVIADSFCGNDDEDDEYGGTCHDIQFNLDQLAAIAAELPAVIVTDEK